MTRASAATSYLKILEEEKRDWVELVLRQDGIEPIHDVLERLTKSVESSIAQFREEQALRSSYREQHDALRRLWQLAKQQHPPVGQIRALIRKLPSDAISEIECRAKILWPRAIKSEPPQNGFAAWAQTAPRNELIDVVLTLASNGGLIVRGRTRPGGRRSRPRLEPVILGRARGVAARSSAGTGVSLDCGHAARPNGRPRARAPDKLVMDLAIDWTKATGQMPKEGRSDRTGFGALVHHVFDWLGIETAEQSLRRYWAAVTATVVTPIDEGIELR